MVTFAETSNSFYGLKYPHTRLIDVIRNLQECYYLDSKSVVNKIKEELKKPQKHCMSALGRFHFTLIILYWFILYWLLLLFATLFALNIETQWVPFCDFVSWKLCPSKFLYVTSFSSISYWSNSDYWPQKHVQSGNIHSKILDVYVERQSAQNFIFLPFLHIDHQFHSASMILIKNLTLFRPSLILGEQDWERASFLIEASGPHNRGQT